MLGAPSIGGSKRPECFTYPIIYNEDNTLVHGQLSTPSTPFGRATHRGQETPFCQYVGVPEMATLCTISTFSSPLHAALLFADT